MITMIFEIIRNHQTTLFIFYTCESFENKSSVAIVSFCVHFFSLILLTGKVWLIGQLKFPHLNVSKLTARPMVVTEWFKKATSKTLNTGDHPSPTSQKHERGQDWKIPKSSKGICCVHNPELFVSLVFHILCKPITTGTVLWTLCEDTNQQQQENECNQNVQARGSGTGFHWSYLLRSIQWSCKWQQASVCQLSGVLLCVMSPRRHPGLLRHTLCSA